MNEIGRDSVFGQEHHMKSSKTLQCQSVCVWVVRNPYLANFHKMNSPMTTALNSDSAKAILKSQLKLYV